MALNVVSKVNTRLTFLYQNNKFLSPQFEVTKIQSKCVRFCLQVDNGAHVGITEFKRINWLPADLDKVSVQACLNFFVIDVPYT